MLCDARRLLRALSLSRRPAAFVSFYDFDTSLYHKMRECLMASGASDTATTPATTLASVGAQTLLAQAPVQPSANYTDACAHIMHAQSHRTLARRLICTSLVSSPPPPFAPAPPARASSRHAKASASLPCAPPHKRVCVCSRACVCVRVRACSRVRSNCHAVVPCRLRRCARLRH
jgi:hypothetical protein